MKRGKKLVNSLSLAYDEKNIKEKKGIPNFINLRNLHRNSQETSQNGKKEELSLFLQPCGEHKPKKSESPFQKFNESSILRRRKKRKKGRLAKCKWKEMKGWIGRMCSKDFA
ncbi:hypothetical protein AVEN_68985-1 [Araneus ventricosus]|uniref:Uncharacterized protein n=1 Tax=Araneus ventricosus TaxID=182803 RepID=A0A4Y2TGX6_ARAVE|nr:hypothetical protein AVEN_190302-1 [Araneus ventricosus]GBN99868.1 hypothetical protein AVEN_214796-1 [Araneus ventricosus]GBO00078.1 hypothetical protein AVEN_14006-1 [Araneus ventricosus]GBO00079.1 hypothetical protein AVEN_68985-1 [Araneus ventricosus]